MRYQFCIRFEKTTENTAATKAVLDCNTIFLAQGYQDYTLTVWDNSKKLRYYLLLIKELYNFLKAVEKDSVIGIQYPLLSINNVFNYFIKLAKAKGVKFFCIVHDLESLRTGGLDKAAIKREIVNLNAFDHVIAHNRAMIGWLNQHGLTTNVSEIGLFDYLVPLQPAKELTPINRSIAFAGNLGKSTFIYKLIKLTNWNFNLYGPNYVDKNGSEDNLHWRGSYSPEAIAGKMEGDFGLIWDGTEIDRCEGVMGNYLRFNNPHKFSLYMAAGLPVIAPANSAIGDFIKTNQLGLLVSNLYELSQVKISDDKYQQFRKNVVAFQDKVRSGYYFKSAILEAEKQLQV
jgi:hypothetical protein